MQWLSLTRRAVVYRLADIVCQQQHTHTALSHVLCPGPCCTKALALVNWQLLRSAARRNQSSAARPPCRLLSGLPCRVFVWCADCVACCVSPSPNSWMPCYCLRRIAGRTPAWRRAAQPNRSVLLLGGALPADAAWRAGSACREHPWCRLGANPTACGIPCSGVCVCASCSGAEA